MNNHDEEEQEIIAAFEAGKLKSQQPSREQLERHRSYARTTISSEDLLDSRLQPVAFVV
jgi:hypothetical protein